MPFLLVPGTGMSGVCASLKEMGTGSGGPPVGRVVPELFSGIFGFLEE